MFHIILLILKIIGILLLVLLGIFLLLLLTVLLVPLRYRIRAAHGEDYLELEGSASWLLHLLHAQVTMEENKPHIRARIFGFLIFDNFREKKVKIKKSKSRKSKKAGKARVRKPNAEVPVKSLEAEKENARTRESSIIKTETLGEVKTDKETIAIKPVKPDIPSEDDLKVSKRKLTEDTVHKEIGEPKKSVFRRILDKLRAIKDRIVTFFKELKGRIKKGIEAALNIKRKINLLLEFLRDEINRKAFKITYSSLIRLLKHILPTKLRSSITFGTGDPCSTGQILGVLGILYSFYGDKVQITPDFENKRLEGRLYARGRIRLVTILIIVIKLILDKRFKELRSNLKTLKEAL